MDIPVRVESLSKRYRLGLAHRTLRETVSSLPGRLLHRAQSRPADDSADLWALRDVSFEVKSGQALGVIGPNGAGKTTLLKLLSRVTYPSSGKIRMSGRVSSLIELGAGFHPDLTGRENIRLNGVILGLKPREVDSLFDQIVEFAELRRFIDTPVKRYSSGMYVRLGFAVAAHVDPDILLIDEVLSVGDMAFRAKCTERMKQLRARGTTILFVSHNMHAVVGLCENTLLLDRGQVALYGPTEDAIHAYQRLVHRADAINAPSHQRTRKMGSEKTIDILQVELLDAEGQPREVYEMGESLVARIEYCANRRLENVLFSAGILRADGLNACSETSSGQVEPDFLEGPGRVELVVPVIRLTPAVYTLVILIIDRGFLKPYAMERVATFQVVATGRYIDESYGVFLPDFHWRLLSPLAQNSDVPS